MKSFLLNVSFFGLVLCVSSCTFMKMVYLNNPSIYDQKHFPNEVILATNPTNISATTCDDISLPPVKDWTKFEDTQYDLPLDQFLKETNTTTFIVMRNDSILYENYFNGNTIDKQNIVFSITKAFITSLLAITIDEGHIKSLEQYVGEFVDAYKVGRKRLIKIKDVLQMTSGIDHGDYRSPMKIGQAYYNGNLDNYISKVKVETRAGIKFEYKSVDTQVLGMVIEAATGKQISELLFEKIWKPMGMEYDAYFTKDRTDGNERMYGGMAITSRDILKLGMLYLKNGNWNGKQIIPEDWVNSLSSRTQVDGKWWGYNKGWWLETFIDGNYLEGKDYYASGYQGQYLYINPLQNLIILRQGINPGGIRWYSAIGHLAKILANEQSDSISNNINVIDHPHQFEGTYRAKNGKQLFIKKEKGNRWQVSIVANHRKEKFEVTSHSTLALTNERKLKLVLFDFKDGVVKGLHFDRSVKKPTYFEKVNQTILSSLK